MPGIPLDCRRVRQPYGNKSRRRCCPRVRLNHRNLQPTPFSEMDFPEHGGPNRSRQHARVGNWCSGEACHFLHQFPESCRLCQVQEVAATIAYLHFRGNKRHEPVRCFSHQGSFWCPLLELFSPRSCVCRAPDSVAILVYLKTILHFFA